MAIRNPNQKLQNSGDLPKIEVLEDPKAIARYGGTRMLIAPAKAYDELMKRVPEGRLVTTARLREHLAARHAADFTCPLTCGIFVNVCAQASAERAGEDETPYWRTLKNGGELNEKYPGGVEAQKLRLELEGHTVVPKGKRWFVRDYESKLIDL